MKNILILAFFLSVFINFSCDKTIKPPNNPVVSDTIVPFDTTYNLGAGFRFSEYGPAYDPGIEYWDSVGKIISNDFENSTPECIWIVGVIEGGGSCHLNFPVSGNYDLIYGDINDANEEVFKLFDSSGFRVWLQVEPGNASVDDLISIVLNRYAHHKCITGFGVDVEWLETSTPIGRQVTDAEANKWISGIKQYNSKYRLFLKHWEIDKMPPNAREDIVFIDDSQMFNDMNEMIAEFILWGKAFEPSDVGFQYGYNQDKSWWQNYQNPSKTIGDEIIEKIPNAKSLFWVDFTILEVFPQNKR